ncbi:MAG: endolytic transglycosylase MltG [Peptococcaceae bacterium]|nr:endolytic transglycosylase MltG [Peptococcaceae bacterium]
MRRKKSLMPKVVGVFFVLVLLGFIACTAGVLFFMSPAAQVGQTEKVEVVSGATARGIAADLEEQGLIRNKLIFDLLCRYYQVDSTLKVGVYQISPAMSMQEIIDVLKAGPKVERVSVSIPEGFRVDQIIDKLVESGFGDQQGFYDAAEAVSVEKFAFLKEVPATIVEPGNRLEGFLFPDTYLFDKNMAPQQVLEMMLVRFETELTDEVKQKLAARDMSVFEWAIKASVVEREALVDVERPLVASVFENRLKKGMKFESCATVEYVLKENKPFLTYEDIKINSLYNTYIYEGLPPGPIACPGKKSFEAALDPADTKYLFFCAKGDGTQVFAETNAEHERNRARYVN